MGDVCYLIEGLVLSSNLDGNAAIYHEVSLRLAVFHGMAYWELVNNEAFPQGADVQNLDERRPREGNLQIRPQVDDFLQNLV